MRSEKRRDVHGSISGRLLKSLAGVLLAIAPALHPAVAAAGDFDHLRTGFPLTGAHERARCESCHLRGIFEGTPKACARCHGGGLAQEAASKPANHVPSSEACGDCHVTTAWAIARFDHGGISGGCASCHNGSTAPGKTRDHVPSPNQCEVCHRTIAWTPADFDHAGVNGNCFGCHNGSFASGKSRDHIPSTNLCGDCHDTSSWRLAGGFDHVGVTGNCGSCHDGGTAAGKTRNHIVSSNRCEDCHSTNSWAIAGGFDHASVTRNCVSCHDGNTATGKSRNHIASSTRCEDCHNTASWSIAGGFNHSGVTGNCGSCHNGSLATGKPSRHFVTSVDCAECHGTRGWGSIDFTHSSPTYPGDHSGGVDCVDCHTSNSQAATWTSGAYRPDCAGCHAGDFKPGPHKKTENPDRRYTVSELRDCSGACHIYADSSLSRIKKSRSGKHRSGNGDF